MNPLSPTDSSASSPPNIPATPWPSEELEVTNTSSESASDYMRMPSMGSSDTPMLQRYLTPHNGSRAPTAADNNFAIGAFWFFEDSVYVLKDIVEGAAIWGRLKLEFPPQDIS